MRIAVLLLVLTLGFGCSNTAVPLGEPGPDPGTRADAAISADGGGVGSPPTDAGARAVDAEPSPLDAETGSPADAGTTPRRDAGTQVGRRLCAINDTVNLVADGIGPVILKTQELESCGDAPVQILSATLGGRYAGESPSPAFSLSTPPLPTTLAPGERFSFEVSYRSDAYGVFVAAVNFVSDADPSQLSISVVGYTREPTTLVHCALSSTSTFCNLEMIGVGVITDRMPHEIMLQGDASCEIHGVVEATPPRAFIGPQVLGGLGGDSPLDLALPNVVEVRFAGTASVGGGGVLRISGRNGTTGPDCSFPLFAPPR
ncbi:MAG: hypothetical protein U1E65_15950 [Myxococcota bacterium]